MYKHKSTNFNIYIYIFIHLFIVFICYGLQNKQMSENWTCLNSPAQLNSVNTQFLHLHPELYERLMNLKQLLGFVVYILQSKILWACTFHYIWYNHNKVYLTSWCMHKEVQSLALVFCASPHTECPRRLVICTWLAGLVQSWPNSLNFAKRVNGQLARERKKKKHSEIVISREEPSE